MEVLQTLVGKCHPLIVHLPIGFIGFCALLDLLDLRLQKYTEVRRLLLLALCASAILAAVAGYILSLGGSYEGNLVSLHMYSGFAWCALTLVWYVWHRFGNRSKSFLTLYYVLAFSNYTLVAAVGHYGGSLTHGENYFDIDSPETSSVGVPIQKVPIDSAQLYAHVIQPIFNAKCVSCHNSSKQKGKFRLDSFNKLMEGGATGAAIVPGVGLESELLKRITMDPVEKGAMPPKGKTPLSPDEVLLIESWIALGAGNKTKVTEWTEYKSHTDLLAQYVTGLDNLQVQKDTLPNIPPCTNEARAALEKTGLLIAPLFEGSNYLDLRLINGKSAWNDQKANALRDCAPQIAILDLSNTSIGTKTVESIAACTHMQSLYLQNTSLNDAQLTLLEPLSHLQILNIHHTNVTDVSVAVLAALPIKKVYLWQTKISKTGIGKLKALRPDLEIIENPTNVLL